MLGIIIVISFFFLFLPISLSYAIVNPLSTPNNKIGIHILFDTELLDAARLVNANGGDWGYITIPIQAGDKDLVKWQNFMDIARKYHLIPIIRLATEGDYFNTKVWRKPTLADVVDFANFLNSLQWPTKNRYVIVFNEVNRADEWGGTVNPAEYADLLSYAVSVFKSKSPNFFIISAGLDNAAPNQGTTFMDHYDYMTQMNTAIPGIFNQIDGLASHSYPNPAFSQPPDISNRMGIGSFVYEYQLADSLSNKKLPVFITETGWSSDTVTDDTISSYYQQTFANIWSDSNIVAITPFLLKAGEGPFKQFSFLKEDGTPSKIYSLFQNMQKIKGQPVLSPQVLVEGIDTSKQKIPVKDFTNSNLNRHLKFSPSEILKSVFEWILKI